MELNEYQFKASETNIYPRNRLGVMAIALALNEEAGEVASLLQKAIRDDYSLGLEALNMKKELGDVLWQLSQLADRFGFTLDEVAQANIMKLADRQERNVIGGSGDDR